MACCSSPSSAAFPPSLLRPRQLRPPRRQTLAGGRRPRPSAAVSAAAFSDPFVVEIAEKLEDSLSSSSSSPSPPLEKLRLSASQSLLSKPWPTAKDEPFRFTDTSFLKTSQVLPIIHPSSACPLADLPQSPSPNSLYIVDGRVAEPSRLSALPPGAFAGSVSDLSPGPVFDKVLAALSAGFQGGDLFWDLNGAGVADVAVIYVPAGVRIADDPVHLRFLYSEAGEVGSGKLPMSNPRVLVLVEKGAELAIVEEHSGVGGTEERCYWANSVMEIVIEEGAKVSHSYVQRQSANSAHIKWTFTRQESSSTYELVEVSTGGRLNRHNLHIQQLGPDTATDLSAFHLSQNNQTQDLHSRLVLDHPRGFSRQLHKCIVANSSGHAVFDGNIKVNRYAQETDAGQLTRSLLLAPRATVNVKPNLQIIADDVKCSHGAAISDLEEDQLFYFLARGIDQRTARNALVFSFGAEVIARIRYEPLRKSVTSQVKELLEARRAGD